VGAGWGAGGAEPAEYGCFRLNHRTTSACSLPEKPFESSLNSDLPAQQRSADGESSAHARNQHKVALMNAVFFDRRGHCQRDRRGRGVAEAIDVDDDFL